MDRRATEGTSLIDLGGRAVEYRFARRRRRTLGITVDADGLRVAAPLRAPWREIEAFLRQKERWILGKLDEWSRVAPAPVLRCATGERLPVFGEPRELEVRLGRRGVHEDGDRLVVCARKGARPLPILVSWLKQKALASLAPRASHYSLRLGRDAPRVVISNARTQWGLCTEAGADYVVAHEVAHLVELNHSRRFWSVVGELYPAWREARERLELAGASLPILRGEP
jgi:predicted metal-dependent hydrolase